MDQREEMEVEQGKRAEGEELRCLTALNQNVMNGNYEDQITMRNRIARKWKRIGRSP